MGPSHFSSVSMPFLMIHIWQDIFRYLYWGQPFILEGQSLGLYLVKERFYSLCSNNPILIVIVPHAITSPFTLWFHP